MRKHAFIPLALLTLFAARCDCGGTLPNTPGDDGGSGVGGDGGMNNASSGGSGSGSSGGSSGSSGAGGDAGSFCEGSGPSVIIGSPDAGAICGGDLAQITFRWGLCICEDMALASVLETDAFDSAAGPYTQGTIGGAVGVNGTYRNLAVSDINGSLFTGVDLRPIGDHDFRGEVHVGGAAVAAGDIHVFHDTWVTEEIRGIRWVIDGDLHIPAGATVSAAVDAQSVVNEPVNVAPPCGCEESEIIDIASIIASRRTDNDNEVIGLTPDAWESLTAEVDLTLPCGRYYVTGIGAAAAVTLHATGRTALYVDGDIRLAGVLEVELETPEAEMDIFVAGNIVAAGILRFGSSERPARVRTYVAGTEDILLAGDLDFGGNLYAPRARVMAAGPMEIFGSIFARSMVEAGLVTVHYDKAVLVAGNSCGTADSPDGGPGIPSGSCQSCTDCLNQACVGGTCGACTDSSECCAPLVCEEGRCISIPG
ncbi:MAG: hypothetical protein AB2A00_17700 [Myxococcota bacterium]